MSEYPARGPRRQGPGVAAGRSIRLLIGVRRRAVAKKKVLFVCIGNSCRSQMAEGFARAYGSDVLEVQSAGLAPAAIVVPLTIKVMKERNVDLRDAWPKSIWEAPGGPFDLVVNMSGYPLPREIRTPERRWPVQDPIAFGLDVYEKVAEDIEARVMQLILELRNEASKAGPGRGGSPREGQRGSYPMGPGGSRTYRRGRN